MKNRTVYAALAKRLTETGPFGWFVERERDGLYILSRSGGCFIVVNEDATGVSAVEKVYWISSLSETPDKKLARRFHFRTLHRALVWSGLDAVERNDPRPGLILKTYTVDEDGNLLTGLIDLAPSTR